MWFAPLEVPKIKILGKISQAWLTRGGYNDSSMCKSAACEGCQTRHVKVVKHSICIWQWCGSYLGWVYSLNHHNMIWFAPWEVIRDLGKISKAWLTRAVPMTHQYVHTHSKWRLSTTQKVFGNVREPSKVGLQPQPLHYDVVCPSGDNHNSSAKLTVWTYVR